MAGARATARVRPSESRVGQAIVDVYDRFTALDNLASKGVHATVAREEAEFCAMSTYLVAGEVIRIHAALSAVD